MGRFFADSSRGNDENALSKIDGEIAVMTALLEKIGMPDDARAFLKNFILRAGEGRKSEIRIMLRCR